MLVAVSTVYGITQAQAREAAVAATPEGKRMARQNAVLVFGATGKLGREIVAQVRDEAAHTPSCHARVPAAGGCNAHRAC